MSRDRRPAERGSGRRGAGRPGERTGRQGRDGSERGGADRGGRQGRDGGDGGAAPRRDRGQQDRGQQVEGRQAVRALLTAGTRRVHDVWLSTDGDSLDDLAALGEAAGARVRRVPVEQIERRARTDAPQGVVAFAAPVPTVDLDALLADPGAFLVALDGVTDPGNLGAIMRTAETAGATGVVVPTHRAVGLTPAVAKAAAGALEYLPVAFVSGVPGALDRAKRAGVWCVALDGDGDASVFDLTVAEERVVLVLGAEGRGVSQLARKRCDVVASIPMHGRIESLNVSAAAAIACAEIARRRTTARPSG
jgi:23S rRNA (guanosine2251-2'-O)-methyltransferase